MYSNVSQCDRDQSRRQSELEFERAIKVQQEEMRRRIERENGPVVGAAPGLAYNTSLILKSDPTISINPGSSLLRRAMPGLRAGLSADQYLESKERMLRYQADLAEQIRQKKERQDAERALWYEAEKEEWPSQEPAPAATDSFSSERKPYSLLPLNTISGPVKILTGHMLPGRRVVSGHPSQESGGFGQLGSTRSSPLRGRQDASPPRQQFGAGLSDSMPVVSELEEPAAQTTTQRPPPSTINFPPALARPTYNIGHHDHKTYFPPLPEASGNISRPPPKAVGGGNDHLMESSPHASSPPRLPAVGRELSLGGGAGVGALRWRQRMEAELNVLRRENSRLQSVEAENSSMLEELFSLREEVKVLKTRYNNDIQRKPKSYPPPRQFGKLPPSRKGKF
jgi:hypothetical protein